MKKRSTVVNIFVAIVVAISMNACFPMASDENNTGINGKDGADGKESLVKTSDEPKGENCLTGGKKIEVGIDTNSNDVLDEDEVTNVSYVCNGESGIDGKDGTDGEDGKDGEDGEDGLNALVEVSDGAPDCSYGGKTITTGIDADRDGKIDADEINGKEYVCNGESQKLLIQGAGALCGTNSNGVKVVQYLDKNNNNKVDTGEKITEFLLCYGNSALIDIVLATAEECPNGGIWVRTGNDLDKDGLIDVSEEKKELLCNGKDGADGDHGHNAISDIQPATDTECPTGGWTVSSYIDENENGNPDPLEKRWSVPICNGHDSLIRLGAPDSICTNGGVKIFVGKDDNGNGVLDDPETDEFTNVCNGIDGIDGKDAPNNYFDAINLPPSAGCPAGCVQLIHWVDYDDNGLMDPTDFQWSRFVQNGLAPEILFEEPDSVCSNGGVRIVVWKDSNGDSFMNTMETRVVDICNGFDGEDGVDAPFVYIERIPEPAGVIVQFTALLPEICSVFVRGV